MTEDERRLYVERQGRGERVCLVHGFTQAGASWHDIATALAANYEVTTVDLPGHGRSGALVPLDFADAATMLGQSVGKASYVGYSMGGRLCLALALDHPELVERLVVIGASPGIADTGEHATRKAADDALAERLDPRFPGASDRLELAAFLDHWLSQDMFADLGPDEADISTRRSNTTAGLAMAFRVLGTGAQSFLGGRLCELSMPVMVMAGDHDEKFAAIATELADAIGPNARRVLVRGALHAAPFRQPAQFVEAVSAFFETTRT